MELHSQRFEKMEGQLAVDNSTPVATSNSLGYNRLPNPCHARIAVQAPVFRTSVAKTLSCHLDGLVASGDWELL
eukprot:1561166-Karenia_brevis.AAC.1